MEFKKSSRRCIGILFLSPKKSEHPSHSLLLIEEGPSVGLVINEGPSCKSTQRLRVEVIIVVVIFYYIKIETKDKGGPGANLGRKGYS